MSTIDSSSSASELPPEAIALAGRLFDAARKGDEASTALLEAALQRGGAGLAGMRNEKGDTLIMLAAYHGHAHLTRLLLRHGANPNILNDRNQSPLSGVVFKNEPECILALLEGGADPDIGTPSAIECCRVFRQDEYLDMFTRQIERLELNGNGRGNGNEIQRDADGLSGDGPHSLANGNSSSNGSGYSHG